MSDLLQLERLPNWRSRLYNALHLDGDKKFTWGEHDCLVGLAVPAIIAITGYDITVHFQQYKYTCAQEAHAHMRAAGFRNIADGMATLFPEIHPSRMTVGDIAAIDSGDGWLSLGVCGGERNMVLSPNGKGTVSMMTAKRAFKIG